MQITQQGMMVLPMDEPHQNSVLAGIPMFEMRSFIGEHKTRPIGSLFDVRTKLDTSSGSPRPIVSWLIGNQAMAKMESRKSGVGVVYFPDDPWWHNRIILINLMRQYSIAALHTPGGVVTGDVISKQMAMLKNKLMCKVPVYRVLENGVAVSDRATREEAEQEIETMNVVELRIDPRTGQQKPIQVKKAIYKIEEIEGEDYRPEIMALAKKYRYLEHGWTECLEFQAIKKELIEEFKALDSESAPSQSPSDIVRMALSGISQADKAKLVAEMLRGESEEEVDTPKRGRKPKEEAPKQEVTV